MAVVYLSYGTSLANKGFNTIKSYLMSLTTRSYGLGCFWHSLVACLVVCSVVA